MNSQAADAAEDMVRVSCEAESGAQHASSNPNGTADHVLCASTPAACQVVAFAFHPRTTLSVRPPSVDSEPDDVLNDVGRDSLAQTDVASNQSVATTMAMATTTTTSVAKILQCC